MNEKDQRKILDIFQVAETTQLPVVEDNKIVGILDLFSFTKTFSYKEKVSEIVNKNIVVEKKDSSLINFNKIQQKILPIVDDDGVYMGFIRSELIQIKNEKKILERLYSKQMQHYIYLEEELKEIINSSSDGIHVTDGNGITLYFNSACERIDGVDASNIVGKHMKELVKCGIYSKSVALEVLEKKVPITILQKVNGKEIMATGTPILKNGKISKVVINSRDITELNNLKRQLKDAHNIKEKFKSELELLRWEQMNEGNIVIKSFKMKKILTLAVRVARVDSTVLIQGESGVGKGVISRLIHHNSSRKNKPFIKIDCGSIPESLLESELFGYEKGSFTGAAKEGKIGLIELANEGTLFLDEIGELPLELQAKLLRVLQDREFLRIGGKKLISVDIRIIAATNKNLKKMIDDKKFREDLYYRLNVVPIFITPLRERKEDIQPLIMNCLDRLNKKYKFAKRINPKALKYLIEYSWPGNVRELENIIERLIVTTSNEVIGLEDLPNLITNYTSKNENIISIGNLSPFKDTMDSYERNLLLNVMEKSKNTKEMSDILKLDRSTIRRKLKKHDISISF
ncbi:sigma 54-interacting transcriptional regulator [Tepidibacter aestuarii]|uniref:sigma 54-interacting transcriptional regulator n=1 Tax=Tepidibacter aestuarii TaxID=2925782 RepID=UPI0020BD5A9C|nr:sigma 54-interacting transcriptional regulator [Tepidibacter aestuarii]